ncbi:hypothetical protein CB1_000743018 [Camelus ferus]|nr:hypothetical protein CB1_000743018 [Camelus ferus]
MSSLRSHLPVELGSVRNPEGQVGRLHRLAVAGGPSWGLTRLLQRVVQVDGENSAGQTALFLSALLGHSSAVRLLLAFGANPNHRCLDGSTPVHAGAFSGRSLVMLHLLQAGGDLRLHDQQGHTPWDWAEQGGAKQSCEMRELLQLCRANISALVHSTTPDLLSDCPLPQGTMAGADQEIPPNSSLRVRPDPKELLPAQGEPDRTYESSSHTLMANLLWRGHPVTVRQLKAPGTQPDVLLADLQHCRRPGTVAVALFTGFPCGPVLGMEPSYWSDYPTAGSTLHHPSLLLLMALSPSADLSGLCLLFEPVWLGSLHVVLHPQGPREVRPRGGPPALCQACCPAACCCSSHAVQLVRPGLAKVGSLEHGRPLHQRWLRPRPQQGYPWGGPGPGLPPPPELYPWLPLELICGDTPAATSDLYSFCILAQEVFTGELPWAGREGPEVKAKLEAGESPALDPLVPAPYQALVRAGLGLGPADRRGSLQSTRYLLREAMAQDSAPEVSSPVDWTTLCPSRQGFPPVVTNPNFPGYLFSDQGAPVIPNCPLTDL